MEACHGVIYGFRAYHLRPVHTYFQLKFACCSLSSVGDFRADKSEFQHEILSLLAGATTFVFLAAVALKLARNTPKAIEFRQKYEAGAIKRGVYEKCVSLQKSQIVNISWVSTIRSIDLTLINNMQKL